MTNSNPEKLIITRKELYDLVWSVPMLTLSKKYEISDAGLRNICYRMNIPLPQAGHWQKIRYGKKITKFSLLQKNSGESEIELLLRQELNELEGWPQSPVKTLSIAIERDSALSLIVPCAGSYNMKLIQKACFPIFFIHFK